MSGPVLYGGKHAAPKALEFCHWWGCEQKATTTICLEYCDRHTFDDPEAGYVFVSVCDRHARGSKA